MLIRPEIVFCCYVKLIYVVITDTGELISFKLSNFLKIMVNIDNIYTLQY